MQRQSPKAAQGATDFAMLPSAHRKPERRDSKAFKMETQFNTGRAWFLSVALLLGTLGFVLVDHQSRTANLRGHLHEKHARANEQIATLKTRLRGQLSAEARAKEEAQASAEAAQREAAEGKKNYQQARETAETIRQARDTLKAERDTARLERDVVSGAARKDALAVKGKLELEIEKVKDELKNWKSRAELAVREDNEHKKAAEEALENAKSAAAAKLGEAELNKAAVAAEKNAAEARAAAAERKAENLQTGAAAAEKKVANLQAELTKARGLLKKCQEMFDKRKSELEELRKSHSEDHNQVVAHQKEVEAMKQWSEEAKGQMQELSQRAAQTPAHMSTLEAILARMTARPTEKDVAEAERLQKVMAGAD